MPKEEITQAVVCLMEHRVSVGNRSKQKSGDSRDTPLRLSAWIIFCLPAAAQVDESIHSHLPRVRD